MPIVEATSGNTGISFAALGAYYGHPVHIFMPDWASQERINIMKLYGANVYTGELTYTIYGRRALATFEFHSAVLSQWFQIPALVTTRVFRACQNVILTSFAVYLFAKEVFRKSDDCKTSSFT